VLRCGGGKALTKQTSDENTLKCHMTVEETGKIGDNTLVVCGAQVNPGLEDKIKVNPIKNKIKPKTGKSGKITPELYNLENCATSEKPVKIDLDLYQMENF
jgi:hypothetical protein